MKAGADPALTLSLVIDPPPKVLEASSGDLPSGYRWLTQDEERERDNERARRYNAPVSVKWKNAA